MSIEASNEVRVKDEPIYDSQSILDTREAALSINKSNKITNNDQSIKNERQLIPNSSFKRTREDISSDDEQSNKSKRYSILEKKVKEELIDNEIQTSEEKFSAREEFSNKTSIAFLNEDETSTKNCFRFWTFQEKEHKV